MKTKRKQWDQHVDSMARRDLQKYAGISNNTTEDCKENNPIQKYCLVAEPF